VRQEGSHAKGRIGWQDAQLRTQPGLEPVFSIQFPGEFLGRFIAEGIGMFAWTSGVGTACGLSVVDYLMERKIPWVGPSAGSLHWIEPPRKYLFAVYPLYYIEAKGLCRYAVEK